MCYCWQETVTVCWGMWRTLRRHFSDSEKSLQYKSVASRTYYQWLEVTVQTVKFFNTKTAEQVKPGLDILVSMHQSSTEIRGCFKPVLSLWTKCISVVILWMSSWPVDVCHWWFTSVGSWLGHPDTGNNTAKVPALAPLFFLLCLGVHLAKVESPRGYGFSTISQTKVCFFCSFLLLQAPKPCGSSKS